ncbi:uncharacterized protein AB675_9053 [Cyphellophora attinorum]|uniref:Uncharacterized protein n=1 Tax=Cyphellophora attinorum TaxID=1664694 RepID=A0A0N1NZE2_9EURO|nr:uncharacterized protein AB675_9053 [Phialophora attinorum]KPI41757.1 hypothetical protein AB675_9053 [Phialophora attinorum]
MSDYAYSDPGTPDAFDDLEDLLDDADPTPDLADELAAHALADTVYPLDYDPGYEMQEYYSDWEYYSDDYYDDDPAILRLNPMDGEPPKKKVKASTFNTSKAKGRKRKAAELAEPEEDGHDQRKLYIMTGSMQGTVWATPVPVRNNIYRPGSGKKVALLKDWRERYNLTSPREIAQSGGVKVPDLAKDESWANDLGLADMGLLTERGTATGGGEGGVAGEEGDEDGWEDEAEEGEGDASRPADSIDGDGDLDLTDDGLEFDEDALKILDAAMNSTSADGSLDISKLNLPPEQLAALQAAFAQAEAAEQQQQMPTPAPTQSLQPSEPEPTSKRRKKNKPTHNPAGAKLEVPAAMPPAATLTLTEEEPVIEELHPKLNKVGRKRKASTSPGPDGDETPESPDLDGGRDLKKELSPYVPRATRKQANGRATKRHASAAKR